MRLRYMLDFTFLGHLWRCFLLNPRGLLALEWPVEALILNNSPSLIATVCPSHTPTGFVIEHVPEWFLAAFLTISCGQTEYRLIGH